MIGFGAANVARNLFRVELQVRGTDPLPVDWLELGCVETRQTACGEMAGKWGAGRSTTPCSCP